MSPQDYEDDEVRRVTHECPHRRPTGSSMFGSTNECYHPGAVSEHQESQVYGNAVVSGGVDGYATFCEAVDMHLTSLGEPSRLYVDGNYEVLEGALTIDDSHLLAVSDEENIE